MATRLGNAGSTNDDGYWQALLEQGEVASNTTFPEEPPAHFHRGPRCPVTSGQRGLNAVSLPDEGAGETEELLTDVNKREREWQMLEQAFRTGQLFTARVIGCNRGGLLVRLGEIVGFVPASQIVDLPHQLRSGELRDALEHMMGRELQLKLIELERERNRVILSERAVSWPERDLDSWLASLKPGQVLNGRVRSLCDFGVFIDLGGIDGLVHISEISWQRVNRPGDVLTVGQTTRVVVLNVDVPQRRVGLSIKRLQPDPWSLVHQRYQVGQPIQVVITNVVDFGAFARVEEGVEGLVHISELAEGNFLHPRNVVCEGDVVTARILHIDGSNRRMGLSLRQARISGDGSSCLQSTVESHMDDMDPKLNNGERG